MVSRLLDLVVLVAEMSQRNDKSFKELDKELKHLGYSPAEIEQALFWVSSNFKPLGGEGAYLYDLLASRVLSPWEAAALGSESHGYLLRLLNLGILDAEQFEKILARVHPFGGERITLGDVKTLVGAVLFNHIPGDFEEEPFDLIDEEPPRT